LIHRAILNSAFLILHCPFPSTPKKAILQTIRTYQKQAFPGKLKCSVLLALWVWLAFVVVSPARTVPDPADATGFFTTVADKLLRSTFSFGITNIPVQTNGVFVYTPAVHRLLQVAANVRDAATTNFYPTVFRPVFFRDAQGNVFITGYEQILSATQSDNPLAQPLLAPDLPPGVSTNNVYDVPWIIGAKKGFPAFNRFVMRSDFQITRKLQVSRTKIESYTSATSKDFETNQMIIMAITNHIGFSLWNSYAADYVSPNGSNLTVGLQGTMNKVLSNAIHNLPVTYFNWPNPIPNSFFTGTSPTFTTWAGSAWNSGISPAYRQAAMASFVTGSFNFPFLPESVYRFATGDFISTSLNPGFETSANITPTINPIPQFDLMTTNGIQAYILDGDQIIDYVHFSGPNSLRNLNDEIQDPFTGINSAPYQMWITNASGIASNGMNWGVMNQIVVSQTGPSVAPPGTGNSWKAPPNLPLGVPAIPAAEAAFFSGFFTITWIYNGKVYQNTNLVIQAPYTPTRTAYAYTIWQANDPLVHSLSSDLTQVTSDTGLHHSDDLVNQPLPSVVNDLAKVSDRYQPWGRNFQMEGVVGVLHDAPENASYNLAYRDPLVWGSDAWNFPATNSLPLTTLGQIHRGTPWQTIYLKGTNLLNFIDPAQQNPNVGLTTWQWWTGDFNATDAALMSPASDWRLAALLTELFNTNDATQLASVNSPTTGWSNILDGLTVQTNTTPAPYFNVTPQLDPVTMTGNSPQAAFIASALAQAKAGQLTQQFISVGDILSAPELSQSSPWLNRNDAVYSNDEVDYGISDEAYEAIPAQLLARLRPDSTGSIITTNGTTSIQFSGADAYEYAVQVSSNLVNWQTIATNHPAAGTFSVPAGSSQNLFYRSVLLP